MQVGVQVQGGVQVGVQVQVRVLKLEFAMESFGVGSWTPRVYVGGDATVWAM
eukprot:SAG11_NODE_41704_length_190_cov_125.428571_1_plen_51_part_10